MPLFSGIKSAEKEYRPLPMIAIGGILFSLGNAAMWFFLPIFAEKLFDDLIIVGLLIAIPSAISMFLDIPAGGLSDRIGRKKLLLTGLMVMAILGLLLPSVDSLIKFMVFMLFFGFANLSIAVPIRAYVMDIAPQGKTSEYFGIFEASHQIGFAVGPVAAGYFISTELNLSLSNTGIFYFLTCIAAALVLLIVKETVIKNKSTFVNIKEAITKDRVFIKSLLDYKDLHYAGVAILMSTFIIVFVDGIAWTFEPLYTTLGLSTETVGLILAMFVVPFILFEIPAGIIADKFGKIRVFIAGLVFAGIFLIIFGSTRDPTLMLLSAFLLTTGIAFARPAMDGFLTDISSKKERGGIVGVWNVAEDSAYVVSPIVGGVIAEVFGIGVTFMVVGVALIVATPLIYLAIKKSKF